MLIYFEPDHLLINFKIDIFNLDYTDLFRLHNTVLLHYELILNCDILKKLAFYCGVPFQFYNRIQFEFFLLENTNGISI